MWLASSPVHYSPDYDYLLCPSEPSELWSTSTLLQLCAVLIGWLVSYAIHFKSANFHFGCNSQLISQLMIDPFPTMMTTGWLIFRTLPIINTGKHVTRQYCQIPERGILISGSKGIKDAALYSDGSVINDKSEKAEKSCKEKRVWKWHYWPLLPNCIRSAGLQAGVTYQQL